MTSKILPFNGALPNEPTPPPPHPPNSMPPVSAFTRNPRQFTLLNPTKAHLPGELKSEEKEKPRCC